MTDVSDRNFIFADLPERNLEDLNEKIGKLRVLVLPEDNSIKEIILKSAKISRIMDNKNLSDSQMFYRFEFEVDIEGERRYEISLDTFFADDFQYDEPEWTIETDKVDYWFNPEVGFQFERNGKESEFVNLLRDTLIELDFFEPLIFTDFNRESLKNYQKQVEEHYQNELLPHLPGIVDVQYFNEAYIGLVLQNGLVINALIRDIQEKIEKL